MADDRYISLVSKELEGSISPQEEQDLKEWISISVENQNTYQSIKEVWQLTDAYPIDAAVNLDKAFEQVQDKIQVKERPTYKLRSNRTWWAVAAGLALMISALWVWTSDAPPEVINHLAVVNDQSFTLPDQSRIRLKKGSTISYDKAFIKRKVVFEGSGYFDIARDEVRSFDIVGSSSRVVILGTRFYYSDPRDSEAGFVQMSHGKVRLEVGNASTTLERDEGVRYGDGVIDRNKEYISPKAYSWHTKTLTFEDAPLPKVIAEVSKVFEKIILVDEVIANCTFTGELEANAIENVLDILTEVYDASWTKTENGYSITGGRCG